jgi:RNA:NAD 2'-phosphotransferase (TPT1/KptA family)
MFITRHAYKRGKQRLGLKRKALQRMAKKALKKGDSHRDAKGAFKRYLDSVYYSHRNANNLKVYGHHIYLFRDATLITIYHVPTKFIKHLTLNQS